MITETTLRGDGKFTVIGSDYTLSRTARVENIQPSTGGLSVLLPDARLMKAGGPAFFLVNVGLSSFTLKDNASGTLLTVASAECAQVSCVGTSTAAGKWLAVTSPMTGISPSGSGTGVVSLSSTMQVDTAFTAFLDVHGTVLLDAILTADTNFTADLTNATEKLLSAQMTITTAFTADFASFPTTNICSSTATGTGDGTIGDPWTIKQAAAAVSAGATVYLRGGTYARASNHTIDAVNETVNNGSSGSGYITFKAYPGETPTILSTFNVHDAEYLHIEGLHFHSGYAYWLTTGVTTGTTNHIVMHNCSFTSDLGANQYFTGLYVWDCDDFKMTGCTFYPWHGGDALRVYYSSDVLIEDCDFGQAGGNHNLIGFIDVIDGVIRNCKFRNPWARCFSLRESNTAGPLVVENCVFIDCDWDGVSPESGDDAWEWGSAEICRLASNRIIYRNNILVGAEGGKMHRNGGTSDYDYSGALTFNLHDSYNEVEHNRVYHNVVWSNRLSTFAAFANTSAGTLYTEGNRFLNNVFSNPEFYNIRVGDDQYDVFSWLFDTNVIYHPTNTEDIYLIQDPDRTLSVAEAEAAWSTVFMNSIDGAPTFVDSSLLATIDANPALMAAHDLEDFFEAFALASGNGYQAARELANVTATAGPTTTITVDDAYVFYAGNNWISGDSIIIGTNDAVEVTAINSATSITVGTSISVTSGDKIYMASTGSNPSCGVRPLAGATSTSFSATLTADTNFTADLTYDTMTLAATMTADTDFTAEIDTTNNIAQMLHEDGDTSEYDSFTSGGGDLSVTGAAAMASTSYGLQALINSTDSMYGDKNFTWSTDYLRWRLYFDPNGLSTTANASFYFCDILTAASSLRGYVSGYVDTGGNYSVKAAVTDDAYGNQSTSSYTITDAPHYIEVEIKRASSAVASDGHLKLWVDGSLKETVSSIDLYDLSRPAKMRVGATRSINAGLSGTYYLDEFIVKDSSTAIGA